MSTCRLLVFVMLVVLFTPVPGHGLTHHLWDLTDEILEPLFIDEPDRAVREVRFQEVYRRKEDGQLQSLIRREELALEAQMTGPVWIGRIRGAGGRSDLRRVNGTSRYRLQGNQVFTEAEFNRRSSPWRILWSASTGSTQGNWNHPGVARYGLTPRMDERSSMASIGIEYPLQSGWVPALSWRWQDDRLNLENPRLEYRLRDSYPVWKLQRQWQDRHRQRVVVRGFSWRDEGDWMRPGVWPVGRIGQEEKNLDIRWQGESPGGRRQWSARYHRGKHGLNGRYLPGRINPLLKFATLSSDFSEILDFRLLEVGIRRRGKTTVAISLGRLTETSDSYERREFLLAAPDVDRQQHSSRHDFVRLEMHRRIRLANHRLKLTWNQWIPLASREYKPAVSSSAGAGSGGGVVAMAGSRSDSSVRGGTTLTLSLDF